MAEEFAVVILAGGASTRLGAFKPSVKLNGRPLISHALGIARKSARDIFVMVRSREEGESIRKLAGSAGYAIILDRKDAGPFPNGMAASIRELDKNLIFLMGCDMPFLDYRLPALLLELIGEHGAALPSWPNGFVEPLTALYRPRRMPRGAVSSLKELAYAMDPALIEVAELGLARDSFMNINTQEDLIRAEGMAQTRSIST